LPLPDGGVLVINNTSLPKFDIRLRQPNKLYTLWHVIELLWLGFQSRCDFEIRPARFLSENILTLPVFQGLKKEKLSSLLDMVEACTKNMYHNF
jgi:hypothetical protein